MSSFLRTIQRTTGKVLDEDNKWTTGSKRAHFNGRGTQLGTKNAKDPCASRRHKKAPKPWRAASKVDPKSIKPKLPRSAFTQPIAPDRPDKQTHAARMAARRAKYDRDRFTTPLEGVAANINRRTGAPHTHAREIARRRCPLT